MAFGSGSRTKQFSKQMKSRQGERGHKGESEYGI